MSRTIAIIEKLRYYFEVLSHLVSYALAYLVDNINTWRKDHLTERQFTYFLAITIGFISGLGAIVIKNSVHAIQYMLTAGFFDEYSYVLYIFYPVVGILIAQWVIRKLVKQDVNHGIPNTLYAISKRNALIKKHNLYSSFVTASITVGFGGSAGLEGPTVGTTSAWGANLARLFKMPYKTRTLLIGCAAAGAMASLFNAPIAAIVFAIEVIMLDLTTASLIPLLLASATAAITSKFFLGGGILFHFNITEEVRFSHLPYYIGLGIFMGVASLHFYSVFTYINKVFDRMKRQRSKTIIAGTMLGTLLFLLPPLYGEGYEAINAIIEGRPFDILENSMFNQFDGNVYVLLGFVLALGLLKVVATTLTFRAGGIGGTFAPTLFMGAMFGFFFARGINFFGLGEVPESNFTLVAMAGMMAGNLHAPLMAIFLIAEITGGYELFVPLMLTSTIAFVTVKRFNPHSIYTTQLARRGELITHDKDQAVLTLMRLHREIETDFSCVDPYDKLGDLVKVISHSKRNLFPVVDKKNNLIGIVNLNEIRDVIFNQEFYENTHVHDLMNDAPDFVRKEDNMDTVMQKFEQSGAWNLPVLDSDGHYVGFVSKSKLFSAYRSLLKDFYDS
jgi:CIC family chloride channel protein